MTKVENKPAIAAVKELFAQNPDGLKKLVRAVMQEMLEAEMTDALGAAKGERSDERLDYRSGYYDRTLITRVGKLEQRVRKIGTNGFRPSCLSVTNGPSKPW
jgi:putative transposase